MSEVNINYKGSKIAGMDASGTKTLLTSGKYCEGDISVEYTQPAPSLQGKSKSYTPTETAQSEVIMPDSGYDGLKRVDVQVNAISRTYIGSGIPQRTSADVTVYEDQVSAPNGYYPTAFIKTVASGSAKPASSISATGATVTAGTNTLTLSKSVSNTPQVTEGYVFSGTADNSSVSLTASVNTRSSSDLTASGATVTAPAGYYASSASKSVSTMTLPEFMSSTSSGTFRNGLQGTDTVKYLNIPQGYNETAQYYQISAASGTAGTPTATKGTVSNHSIAVTPSVTNTTGYITGSTKTGTAVTISASELVSGSQTISSNGTTDVTNLASVTVAIPIVTYYTGSSNPSSGTGSNGDIYLKVVS